MAERAALTGHILWNHTEPSFTWLPFFLIRSLHFGHVPIGSLRVSSGRMTQRPVLYTTREDA